MTPKKLVPTLTEVLGWPATVSLTQAATAHNISPNTALEMRRKGTLPFETFQYGSRWMVRTADLLRSLGAETLMRGLGGQS